MKHDDGIWYHPGYAEYEVEGIASFTSSDWLWALEWPRPVVTDSFLALVPPEPAGRCLGIRPASVERVFLGAEEALVRYWRSRICLGECCHSFLRSGEEERGACQEI